MTPACCSIYVKWHACLPFYKHKCISVTFFASCTMFWETWNETPSVFKHSTLFYLTKLTISYFLWIDQYTYHAFVFRWFSLFYDRKHVGATNRAQLICWKCAWKSLVYYVSESPCECDSIIHLFEGCCCYQDTHLIEANVWAFPFKNISSPN